MRIRQVRPQFWSDRRVAVLSKSAKLFYIGLWNVADDDGYIRWDLQQIAGELFPFDALKTREKEAVRDAAILVAAGRIEVLECGAHARIPTLPDHQRSGGEKVRTVSTEHSAKCATTDDYVGLQSPTGSDASNVTLGTVRERDVRLAPKTNGLSTLRENGETPRSLKEVLGPFEDIIGKGRPNA